MGSKKLPNSLSEFQEAYDSVVKSNRDYKKKKRVELKKHTIRVMKIVNRICKKADLPDDITRTAILAACFHDVKKLENDEKHHELGFQWVEKHNKLIKKVLNFEKGSRASLLYGAVSDAVSYHKGTTLEPCHYYGRCKFIFLTSYIGCVVGRIVRYADKLDKKNKGKSWKKVKKALKKSRKYFDYQNKPEWAINLENAIDRATEIYIGASL